MAFINTRRIQSELKQFAKNAPADIFVNVDESDITHFHVLIIGSSLTPYEGGFFYFDYHMPSDYPLSPPRVNLMTTGNGQIRFNPNIYKDGKVCLSILGTWSGPYWSPVLTLSSVMLCIQSLMCENPYYNEPGREGKNLKHLSDSYNIKTQYHTLKHAVGDMLEKKTLLPEGLYRIAKEYFLKNFEKYMDLCDKNIIHDGRLANDGYSSSIKVNFAEEKKRLSSIRHILSLD